MVSLTRDQVRAVDRIAIEKYHIPGIILMENAARGAAEVALKMFDNEPARQILILCGGGNNGGDGLAIARHLHNRGHDILIGVCTDASKYQGDALINWNIIQAMNLQCVPWFKAAKSCLPHLVIDAIFGTGLSETPRPPFADIVHVVEELNAPVLAIDLPSGLDCDTGLPLGPCIRATQTVTFVAPKIGFMNPESAQYTGPVTVADIGCPREAIDEAIKMH